jgi:hypothetical protein
VTAVQCVSAMLEIVTNIKVLQGETLHCKLLEN